MLYTCFVSNYQEKKREKGAFTSAQTRPRQHLGFHNIILAKHHILDQDGKKGRGKFAKNCITSVFIRVYSSTRTHVCVRTRTPIQIHRRTWVILTHLARMFTKNSPQRRNLRQRQRERDYMNMSTNCTQGHHRLANAPRNLQGV